MSNGSAGLNFLKSLTKLINLIGDGKKPQIPKTFLFWRNAYCPHKIRRRVETDCHRQHAETYLAETYLNALEARPSPSDQNFLGNVHVGCGTKRGAEIAAHSCAAICSYFCSSFGTASYMYVS